PLYHGRFHLLRADPTSGRFRRTNVKFQNPSDDEQCDPKLQQLTIISIQRNLRSAVPTYTPISPLSRQQDLACPSGVVPGRESDRRLQQTERRHQTDVLEWC